MNFKGIKLTNDFHIVLKIYRITRLCSVSMTITDSINSTFQLKRVTRPNHVQKKMLHYRNIQF